MAPGRRDEALRLADEFRIEADWAGRPWHWAPPGSETAGGAVSPREQFMAAGFGDPLDPAVQARYAEAARRLLQGG